MIVCAGRNENFEFAKSIGVGLIETSINLTEICLTNKPDFILFIGSAGSYGQHNIFDIIESNCASNLELSFLNNDSYTPLDKFLESSNQDIINSTIVNSSNYITTNFELSKLYYDYNIGIENMEFFSILQVANKFNIPARGIFIVTNYTNDSAHRDFIKNHNSAMSKLTQYLIEKKIIK